MRRRGTQTADDKGPNDTDDGLCDGATSWAFAERTSDAGRWPAWVFASLLRARFGAVAALSFCVSILPFAMGPLGPTSPLRAAVVPSGGLAAASASA